MARKILCVSNRVLFFIAITAWTPVMAQDNIIALPKPQLKGLMSVEEAIQKRRSVRKFIDKDLSWEQISQLLWAGQGTTESKAGFHFRSAPSAGALYPMEIYLLTREGIYHYIPEGHSLEVGKRVDARADLTMAALGQDFIARAPVSIVLCAVYERVISKYGKRGLVYTHIEAGHIAQNIHLQATALGLGSVPVGAFQDNVVKKILILPKDQEPLYIIPVGYP